VADPDADTEGPEGPVDPPPPSYPRGNRLGLRHPRPTVVVLIVLLVVVGGAFVWAALQPADARMCNIVGTSGPLRESPEAAFEAWWDDVGARSAASEASEALDEPVAPPTFEDFDRSGDNWEWVFADGHLVLVEVREGNDSVAGFRVSGVNACTFGTLEELGVSDP
jgi:hypothetical protein